MEAKIKENYFPPKIKVVKIALREVLCSSIRGMEGSPIEPFYEDDPISW